MNTSRFYYCFARVRKHRSLLFVNGALCGCEQSTTKVVVHSSPTTPFLLNRNRWSTIPPVFLCCCEARVNCSFYKGLPHAVRSTSVAWPVRMGIDSPLAWNRGRRDAASSNYLCYRSVRYRLSKIIRTSLSTRSNQFFLEVAQLIHRSYTFISILLYFHRHDIDNIDKNVSNKR